MLASLATARFLLSYFLFSVGVRRGAARPIGGLGTPVPALIDRLDIE